MRKFTYLIGALVLFNIGFAQTTNILFEYNNKRPTNQFFSTKSIKAFDASIVSTNKYQPGTSMDLLFMITYSSPDFEFGDSIAMTFPTGLTPTGGSDLICPPGASPDSMLLHIDGQTVSWGRSSVSNYGGMPPGTHEFFVTVDVSASATENFDIDYLVSGDEYGDNPGNNIEGTVTVQKLPNVPDLIPIATGFFDEYYAVPFEQVTSTVRVKITNVGSILTEPTNVTVVNSNNSFSESAAITVPLDLYEVNEAVFTGYAPTTEGVEKFIFKAEASNDFDNTNSTDTATIMIGGTDLIRDGGKMAGAIGTSTTAAGGILGNIFTIGGRDTLNSVISYHSLVREGEKVQSVVYSLDENGVPDALIATSIPTYYVGANKEFVTYFAEGVVLEEGRYFIGLIEDVYSMFLVYTIVPKYVEGTTWGYMNGNWLNLGAVGYKHTYYIRPQFGTKLPEFDIKMVSLDVYKYVIKDGELTVKGVLQNKGTDALTSIDMKYTIDGGTPVVQSLTSSDIGVGMGLIPFEMTTKIVLSEIGDHDIKVYLSEPNGANDADLTNDTIEFMISVMEQAPVKHIFGEEGTGTWCGFCVRGHIYMDSMAQKYPDTWIGVAVHNHDPMTVAEYDTSMRKHINGYPSGLINRAGIYDPGISPNFEDGYKKMIDQVSPVDLSIKNRVYNTETREFTFDVNAKFLATVKGARFNAVISENEVTGTDIGYNQANYYAGGARGPMGGYENLPNPVPAADMVYQHVARAILGGWDGTENSLPETASDGDEKSYTYTITLDNGWDVENSEIIGFIIAEDGSILNCISEDIETGIFDKKQDAASFNVYPNPFNNTLTIDNLDNASSIVISNVLGQTIMNVDVTNSTMSISTSDLNKGVYLITILDNDNNTRTLRVVKQ